MFEYVSPVRSLTLCDIISCFQVFLTQINPMLPDSTVYCMSCFPGPFPGDHDNYEDIYSIVHYRWELHNPFIIQYKHGYNVLCLINIYNHGYNALWMFIDSCRHDIHRKFYQIFLKMYSFWHLWWVVFHLLHTRRCCHIQHGLTHPPELHGLLFLPSEGSEPLSLRHWYESLSLFCPLNPLCVHLSLTSRAGPLVNAEQPSAVMLSHTSRPNCVWAWCLLNAISRAETEEQPLLLACHMAVTAVPLRASVVTHSRALCLAVSLFR